MAVNLGKYQWWIIVVLGKTLLAIGIWYMSQINNNLEKLNDTVMDLGKTVQHVNDKILFIEEKQVFQQHQIEKLQDEKGK